MAAAHKMLKFNCCGKAGDPPRSWWLRLWGTVALQKELFPGVALNTASLLKNQCPDWSLKYSDVCWYRHKCEQQSLNLTDLQELGNIMNMKHAVQGNVVPQKVCCVPWLMLNEKKCCWLLSVSNKQPELADAARGTLRLLLAIFRSKEKIASLTKYCLIHVRYCIMYRAPPQSLSYQHLYIFLNFLFILQVFMGIWGMWQAFHVCIYWWPIWDTSLKAWSC